MPSSPLEPWTKFSVIEYIISSIAKNLFEYEHL